MKDEFLTEAGGGTYKLYEELLYKRDCLLRDAGSLQRAYMKEFGELLTKVFTEKIACIRQKKAIAYCQAEINRGRPVDLQVMQRELDRMMADYRHTLKRMLREYRAAEEAKRCNIVDVERSKKIYRRLARRIHPDMHPQTAQRPVLQELWNRIVEAYHSYDAKLLEELEVLVNRALEEDGLEMLPADIQDIEAKIARLREEISDILTTEPYIYEELLADEDRVREKKEQLQRDLDEMRAYHTQLDEVFQKLIAEGGLYYQWKTD